MNRLSGETILARCCRLLNLRASVCTCMHPECSIDRICVQMDKGGQRWVSVRSLCIFFNIQAIGFMQHRCFVSTRQQAGILYFETWGSTNCSTAILDQPSWRRDLTLSLIFQSRYLLGWPSSINRLTSHARELDRIPGGGTDILLKMCVGCSGLGDDRLVVRTNDSLPNDRAMAT